MLGHMGNRPNLAKSSPINKKIRIQIIPKNELQLYTTCDIRYTKPLDTIAPLKPRNAYKNITKGNGETVTHHLVKRQPRQ